MAFQTFPIRRQMEEAMSQTTWQKLVGGGDPAVNVIKFQPTKLKSQEKSLADLNSSTICPPLPFQSTSFNIFLNHIPAPSLLCYSFHFLPCHLSCLYFAAWRGFMSHFVCLFLLLPSPFISSQWPPFLVRCLSHGIFTGASPWVKTKAKPLNFCWMKGAKCRHAPTPPPTLQHWKQKQVTGMVRYGQDVDWSGA